MVIPSCVKLSRCGTEVHFSHIRRTSLRSLASVPGGVGSCVGWWILGQSYTTSSDVSSPTPHLLQMVHTARHTLCSQYMSSRWWELLLRPIVVCSFHNNFNSAQRSCFSPFTHAPENSFICDFPPLVASLMVGFAES